MFTIRIEDILEAARPIIKERDLPFIMSAYNSLETQLTKEYLAKQLEIAKSAVTEIGLGGKALTSIFLLPLYQEQKIADDTLIQEYGQKVYDIIHGFVRVQKIDTSKSKFHSENFIRLILTQAHDVRVILILLAEKLYELRHIEQHTPLEKDNLCDEIASLYAPLAHRLGLYQIKTEMEEMSMKYLHNDIYKTIAKKLAEKKTERNKYIESFIDPIKRELDKRDISYDIKGRPKSIFSIWNKLKKSNTEFENIYDLFAIRIIIDTDYEQEKNECWNIYSIVSDIYRPNPKRLRDWISTPKPSGYESLHTTVLGPENKWVEVQIRTKRMDEIAEKGHAAHWKYKEGTRAEGELNWLASVRQILESDSKTELEEDKNSRMELYTNEIFVFTPKGDLCKLRTQSTVLDFAYEIHSNIGNSCSAGKVNNKVVSIKHVLQNGDKVEILTSKQQTPKRDWLSFVKTSKARQYIKKYLRDIQYQNVEIGKEILIRKLQNIKVKFGDDAIHKILKHCGFKHATQLYIAASENKLDFAKIKTLFAETLKPDINKKPITIDTQEFQEKLTFKKNILNETENILIIDDFIDSIDYKLAKCCNPIKGDDIFGFVSVGGGIKIHRFTCPNAHNMIEKYPYRILKAQWTHTVRTHEFHVGIRIIGADEISIVSNITQMLSDDLKIRIRHFNISSRDGNFEGLLSLIITDSALLSKILDKIMSIKGVYSAERYDSYQ